MPPWPRQVNTMGIALLLSLDEQLHDISLSRARCLCGLRSLCGLRPAVSASAAPPSWRCSWWCCRKIENGNREEQQVVALVLGRVEKVLVHARVQPLVAVPAVAALVCRLVSVD